MMFLYLHVFHHIAEASNTLTHYSQRDSSSSSSRGHVTHGLQPRGKEQHNRAQAGEECRLLSPVAARAQLNVSDDMTLARKNAHSCSTVLSDMVMPLGWSLALQ